MKRGGPNVPFIGSGHFGTQDDVSPDGQTVYFVNRTPMPATTDVNIVVLRADGARSSNKSDQRLEQTRTFTRRAAARLGQSILAEQEPTVLTSRRNHFHAMSCRDGRSQRVTQILFDIPAAQPHLSRNPGDRSRFVRKQVDELSA